MVGLGESYDDVLEVMDGLRSVDVDILTIGQYLRPSDKQLPIARYIHPDEFAKYKEEAISRGFRYVESGPLVRSSYHAWQHTGEISEPYSAAAQPGPTTLSL
jgi:lipoic acid synthetase